MTAKRQVMVAGFAFCDRQVLMCLKKKPKWQVNHWNGIGGKAESTETPIQAMVRECWEETGNLMEGWQHFCTEMGPDYVVHFFRIDVSDNSGWPRKNDADESLSWAWLTDIPHMSCIGNCYWLIPLALDWRSHQPVIFHTDDRISGRPTW